MKDKHILSPTQNKLMDYIKLKLENDIRVIPYIYDGHFGANTVLQNIEKKVQVINFDNIKNSNSVHLFKKLLSPIVAIISGIITLLASINLQSSANSIVNSVISSNSKNFYAFKYDLGYSKLHFKFRKIKRIVLVENFDSLGKEDLKKLEQLIQFIRDKKINRVLLVIATKHKSTNFINKLFEDDEIPLFQLTKDDVFFFSKNIYKSNLEIDDSDLDLIKALGLDFFVKYYSDIVNFSNKKNIENFFTKVEAILMKILEESNINQETENEVKMLLNFVSIYDKYFTRIDIANFNNNQLKCNNVDIAKDMSILRETPEKGFYFNKEIFKKYYFENYTKYLSPTPIIIYKYLKNEKPFEYLAIIKLYLIDRNICDRITINSYIIKTYYYYEYLNNNPNKTEVLDYLLKIENLESIDIIQFYEKFIKGINISYDELFFISKLLSRNIFDSLSSCMILSLLLQVIKERFKSQELLSSYCNELKKHIILIDNEKAEQKYWSLYFKELYIAFSLETDSIDFKVVELFKKEIDESQINKEMIDFITRNSLRPINRIYLLGSNLFSFKETENLFLKFLMNNKDIFTQQLALLNLSVYYIEKCEYKKSYSIIKKIDSALINNINFDTSLAYINNKTIIDFLVKKSKKEMALQKLEKNINDQKLDSAEFDIVKNNIYAIKISNNLDNLDALNNISINIQNSLEFFNDFSKLYAINNLLYVFFICDSKEKYIDLTNKLFMHFPKLLIKYKSFFEYKFNYILENWNNKDIIEVPSDDNIPAMYNKLLMFGGIERWFE